MLIVSACVMHLMFDKLWMFKIQWEQLFLKDVFQWKNDVKYVTQWSKDIKWLWNIPNVARDVTHELYKWKV